MAAPRKKKSKRGLGRSADQRGKGAVVVAEKTLDSEGKPGLKSTAPVPTARRVRKITDLTQQERERVRRRSTDRQRQRATKAEAEAKGEAVVREEAIREQQLRKPIVIGEREVYVNVDEVKRFIADLGEHQRIVRGGRRLLLQLLRARLRKLSPHK